MELKPNDRNLACDLLIFLNIDPDLVDHDIRQFCRRLQDERSFRHCGINTVGEALLEFNRQGGYPPGMRGRGWKAFIFSLQNNTQ